MIEISSPALVENVVLGKGRKQLRNRTSRTNSDPKYALRPAMSKQRMIIRIADK
jgi:hypothetical protein